MKASVFIYVAFAAAVVGVVIVLRLLRRTGRGGAAAVAGELQPTADIVPQRELPKLPCLKYSAQTVHELVALEGRYRTESLVLGVEAGILRKEARNTAEGLSDEERVVRAVESLEREVNNGGFSQFFFNPSVEFAPIIVESLRRINCPRVADITQRAIDALRLPSVTVEGIEARIDDEDTELDKAIEQCDDEFFENSEPIAERLFAFIKANRDRFSF